MLPMASLLRKAQRGRYAVGAFNVNNLEMLHAVTRAAAARKSPVIISTSEGAIAYAGMGEILALVRAAIDAAGIDAALHLDHGRTMGVVRGCISAGWTSVMYDGSHLPLEQNIRATRKVVALAHRRGVSVEGEIGTIGGAEENVRSRSIIYTDPAAAKEFVERTGVDALAIAIGTSHGAYKFAGRPRLDIARLRGIRSVARVPLVLHGASGVPPQLVRRASRAGARLGSPSGVPDGQVRAAIRSGVCKINTDTDLRLAFICGVREALRYSREVLDPRKVLAPAAALMQQVVERRMRLFGSAGKAR